jgi:hypothetical protein
VNPAGAGEKDVEEFFAFRDRQGRTTERSGALDDVFVLSQKGRADQRLEYAAQACPKDRVGRTTTAKARHQHIGIHNHLDRLWK